MSIRVLFLCPHAAAKSVVAAALLRREAGARGLDLEIDNAGTDPDAAIGPMIRARLEHEGLSMGGPPRLVTKRDLDAADVIVSIGCDRDALVTRQAVQEWSVPDFSQDPDMAFEVLRDRVAHFASTLVP